MSKIGVGVGDEFPLDDGNGGGQTGGQGPRDDRAEFEEWKRRRDAHRAHREEWRGNRDDWHQARHEFKHRMRQTFRENFGGGDWHDRSHRHWGFWPIGLLAIAVPILVIALLFSLISAAFKAPFVMLAIVAILIAAASFRRHHFWHHHAYGHGRRSYGRRHGRDYDVDVKPRSRSGAPAPQQNDGPTPSPNAAQ